MCKIIFEMLLSMHCTCKNRAGNFSGAGLVSVPELSKYFASGLWGKKCLVAESVKKFKVESVSQPALFRGRKCRGASRIIVWKYTFNVARLICTKYLNTKLFNEIFRVSLFHMQNAKIAVYSNFQEGFFQCFKLLLLKSMWQFLYFYIANRNMGRHYYYCR